MSCHRQSPPRSLIMGTGLCLTLVLVAGNAASDPSRSLTAAAIDDARENAPRERRGIAAQSLFAVPEEQPRLFRRHDLVQIVVQERSRANSKSELETEKSASIDGAVRAFPRLTLEDLARLQLFAGRTTDLPRVAVELEKEFEGEGDYKREDDFSTRITAEVLEVLPNGNLVLESRTQIRNDDEISTIRVTGVCRGVDITAANTVLSNQIHDLIIEKRNEGKLREVNEKGVITSFFETLFSF